MPHALIIGASRGIGREFVHQYLADGWRVTATVRNLQAQDELAALGARPVLLDVTQAASMDDFVTTLAGERFDVAVINAGVTGPRTTGLATPTQAEFDAVMHTNVLATMRLAPLLAPLLPPGAKLAVLSSRMGSIGSRTANAVWLYRASKAALNSVLKDVALELGSSGVVCLSLHPGWVRTDMGGAGADIAPEQSVAGMRAVLAHATPADNGSFFNYDGNTLPW